MKPVKNIAIFVFVFTISFSVFSQRPKIGLALSGGGAKGFAHIGILQAIDSAGLKVDYITGTSAGSIMGALYAAGYSGDSIHAIVKKLKWSDMLAPKASLSNVSIEEKPEFNRYSLEVAIENNKFKLSSGILEAQELWLKISELLIPVYTVKQFSDLSIPFKCVATDVSTGKAIVFDSGDLTTAIRASMAIPTVFNAVEYNDTKLVDGGVVCNFPVTEVKNMGADFIIGSSVTAGLAKGSDLNNALEILYQIGFFKGSDDYENQKNSCDIYIHTPLTNFTAGSFSSADEIMNIGKTEGMKFYPYFKRLADSLNAIYPDNFQKNRLPKADSVAIDEIIISGLKNTSTNFFKGKLDLQAGKYYSSTQIAEAIRKVYGTTYYKRITFSLSPNPEANHAKLNLNAVENPLYYFKQGLHYNTFSDIALIVGLSTRKFIFDKSNAFIKLNFSQNFRINAVYHQYINKANTQALKLSLYHENFKFPIYENFKESQEFRNEFSSVNLDLPHYFNRSAEIGIGTAYETNRLKPKISPIQYSVRNNFLNAHLFFLINTLNRADFPQRGWKINGKLEYIFAQHPDKNYYLLSSTVLNIPDKNMLTKNYERISLKIEKFSRLSQHFTLIKKVQVNSTIFNNAYSLNQYFVGGLNDFLRNQSTFAGLQENQIFTSSIASVHLGLQIEATKNVFLLAHANVGTYDFMTTQGLDFSKSKFISGYALTIGYLTPILPIQASIIYSDQTKTFGGSLNIGYAF